MKNKSPLIRFYCPKCGKTPPKDEKLSNDKWNVTKLKCPVCGIQLTLEINRSMNISNK